MTIKFNPQRKETMLRLKTTVLTLALMIGSLATFTQTAQAEWWSSEIPLSFLVSANAATVCLTDPEVTNDGDSGAGTLRQAILDACPNSTIGFSHFFDSPKVITLTTGQLGVAKNLSIVGPGADLVKVSGNGKSRVFAIGGTNLTITISGLTIANGNSGTGDGGGMQNESANTVSLIDLAFINNTSAHGANGAGNGGGLNRGNFGSWNITGCTFSGNTAIRGGGISIASNSTSISDTTISGNTATYEGGGLINSYGYVSIVNSTITGNTVPGQFGFTAGAGGFQNEAASVGNVSVSNSIIAGNTEANGRYPDVIGYYTSGGYNLIGGGDGSLGFTDGVKNDQVGTASSPKNPLLAPLRDNGGPTYTHAPLPGSPAIDNGNSFGWITDQRGSARPVDLPGYVNATGGNGSDIGAFEAENGPDLTVSKSHTDVFTRGGTGYNYSVVVTNSGFGPTNGLVSVVDTLPTALTAIAMAGPGWTCTIQPATCSRTDSLAPGAGYPAITLTVDAANDAPASVTNTVSVSADDDVNAKNNQGADPTTILVSQVVTRTDDRNNPSCAVGDCSLREAINSANASPDLTIIGFSALFNLPQTIILTNGQLSLVTSMRILGKGANLTTVSGNSATRVIFIGAVQSVNITVSGLTIANGRDDLGGGLRQDGHGTVNLNNCSVVDSSASVGGGGVLGSKGTLNISGSTFSGNNAPRGGAVYDLGITTNITNTTITGNGAEGVYNDSGVVNITRSTITANAMSGTASVGFGQKLSIQNSIIAGNGSSYAGCGDVCAGATSGGNNFVGIHGNSTAFTDGINADQVGTVSSPKDPRLAPLGNYGGPTQTQALLHGSPALDTGNSYGSTTDQRGFARPVDLADYTNDPTGDGSDIGAFEAGEAPLNSAPVATGEVYSVDEDITLNTPASGVLSNDTDADGNPLTAQIQTPPANAAAFGLNANGSFSYTPNANFNGTDSFSYTASDGALASSAATVTISVKEVNDAPAAANDSNITNEDTTLVFNASDLVANDSAGPANESGQTLAVSSVTTTSNTHGTVAINNGQVTYQPAANFNGSASFDYKVCDNGTTNGIAAPLCATGIVNITVTAVNDAPVASGGSFSTNEDTPSAPFMLTGSDLDNDPLTFQIVTGPGKGTYNMATGVYTPNANANGSDSFTFVAKDSLSQSLPANVSITINPVNDAPAAAAQSVTTNEDTAKAVTLSGSDVDGDALTYALVSNPSHGSFANRVYTPAANYNGPDSFTFKTNDGTVDSAPATVSITVISVNDPPTANAQSVATNEDTPKAIILTGADVDNDGLTYLLVAAPSHGMFVNGVYTPAANYNGSDSFTFKVNDGSVDSAPATVTITVIAVNDAPVAITDNVSVEEYGQVAITPLSNDTDVDSDVLTVTGVSSASHGNAVLSGSTVTYTPVFGYFGSDSFTYSISDGHGGTASASVNVVVTEVSFSGAINVVLNSVNDAISASNNTTDVKKLSDVSKKLADAFDPAFWVNGVVTDKDGSRIFEDLKQAVQQLSLMIGNKQTSISDSTLSGWLNLLVDTSRRMAKFNIDKASVMPTADVKKLAAAKSAMLTGDRESSNHRWTQAIDYYRTAWSMAGLSMK